MMLRVYWRVVEDHSALIDVPSDVDPEEFLTSHVLAENEGGMSYCAVSDRTLESWEVE